MSRSLGVTLNALGLYGIALVLIAAFAAQLILDELPCPLCPCNASCLRCWRSGRS